MKILILAVFLLSIPVEAMTVAEAKVKIEQIKDKPKKTEQDIADLKEAIQILAGSAFKR